MTRRMDVLPSEVGAVMNRSHFFVRYRMTNSRPRSSRTSMEDTFR